MPPASEQPSAPQPQQVPGAVFGTPYSTLPTPAKPASSPPSPSKGKKRLFGLLVAAAVLILGGGAGAYLGLILPNSPEHLWASALDNTARGYDRLITYADEQKDSKGFKSKGSFKVEGGVVVDGTFEVAANEKTSLAKLDAGAAGTRIVLEARFVVPENAELPDIYIKATGLKGIDGLFGQSVLGRASQQLITSLENQWIAIDHTALAQLEAQVTEPGSPSLTRDDYIAIARAVGEVNRDYLLSDSPDKAVLTVAQAIGKDKRGDRDTYHYKVGYHKEHLKAYVTALRDRLKQTKLAEIAPDKNIEKMFGYEDMLKSIDKLKGTGQADVWVDTGTKLIRAVRFTNHEKPDNFFEMGLNYDGGHEFPFVVTAKSTEGAQAEGMLNLTLDSKANTLKVVVDAKFGKDTETTALTVTATLEPTNETLNVTVPEGAKPWAEALDGLFGGYAPELPPSPIVPL